MVVRLGKVAGWGGAVFLAAAFAAVGISKLQGASAVRWSERFEQWGYPTNAQYVVGMIELLGGVGVLIPRWRRAALLTVGTVMLGAICTHVVNAEFRRVVPPLVLGGLALLLCLSHRQPTAGHTPIAGVDASREPSRASRKGQG